ncbi:MAG: hypothetical protein WD002_04655 [Pseudomonadales bacterium]
MSGCALIPVDPSEGIVGEWQSVVGGFPVSVRYTDTTVQVGDGSAIGYSLNDNELKVAGETSQRRIVSFPSRDEMILRDPLTGSEQRYVRAGSQ